ncbi:MAG: bifunctional phosphopantothenoylcysteine decarboxylase/phosphopantothenate--cysteine ligase CoaBC [Candidatus Marinimicrobia bacterium]|nr:bifunctional phosphopantothenoylcysteine decarboxylase/phosphopantothenate--cysteine ligase CoaBC [Candidatus Neomarinimicrobiota bacterium]MDP6852893.1 bifunctional phosphopantothenoylcysteine decarboxylase/phosphopantothenate--cysteine ligase CoaBC [Candidatus Neomarinimicrobiota bacterium]
MKNKNILIIVTGSIAAYKACEVVRLLRKEGAQVQVMMSRAAQEFVGKATFAALTNNEVITEIFPDTPKAGLEHIEMAIDLDAIVVVPATANTLCKVANGVADDIVSTTLSVCEQPTLFAPAMNFRMWQNQASMDAVEKLRNRGFLILDPEEGKLASLHEGEGRLPEIKDIMNGIRTLFEIPLPLKGKKVLVTAGPTREAIDPVRFISNRSSGKMGYAIAKSARDLGAAVTLITGPTALADVAEVSMIKVETAETMAEEVQNHCPSADYLFMTAAVADYIPAKPSSEKLKRSDKADSLKLKPAVDILKSIKGKTKGMTISFALETSNGEEEAMRKLSQKGVDFVVLNYANEPGSGFDSETNRVVIFDTAGNKKELKKDRKDRIANQLIDFVLNKTSKKTQAV